MKILLGLLAFILILPSWAQTCDSKGPNVIFFTWDGVRPQEFFNKKEIFPTLWSKHAQSGMILGSGSNYQIATVGVSLPSYQAMMLGKSTGCTKNDNCGPLPEKSLLEHIQQELKLNKKDVAVFASWESIMKAAAQNPSTITHGVFPEIMNDGTDDQEMKQIQEKSLRDLPDWVGARKDQYTFALSMHYLKKHCPRLLWISLVDSDEFGHQGNFSGYLESLKRYDGYLDSLLGQLKSMGKYGERTTVIVTTDHSRGIGPFWKSHGYTRFTEKKVFLFATGRGVTSKGHTEDRGNHLMLRPTMEGLLGLNPRGPILPGIKL